MGNWMAINALKKEYNVGGTTGSATTKPANKKTTSTDSAYSNAVKTLQSSGVDSAAASGIMTRNEWRRRRASSGYDTYEEYLDSLVGTAKGDNRPMRVEHNDDYWQNRFETLTAKLAEDHKGEPTYRPAAEALAIVQKEKEQEEFITKYQNKLYEDDFWGQSAASYAQGRIGQDKAKAWNEYYETRDDGDRAYAEELARLEERFQRKNRATLDDDATLPWLSQSFAGYAPQLVDQTKAQVSGGLMGAAGGLLLGNPMAGAKVGATLASGAYSYEIMRGSAFEGLLKLGVDEETARAAANDEAILSALVEMADTGIDLSVLGFTGVIKAITGKTAVKATAKTAGKKLLKALGAYGLNIASETAQEGIQEGVSIANEKRAQNGETGKWNLTKNTYNAFQDAATGDDPEARKRIGEAAGEGGKLAIMTGAPTIAANTVASAYIENQNAKNRRIVNTVIEEGLKTDPGSEAHKKAEAVKAKRDAGETISKEELVEVAVATEQAARDVVESRNATQTAKTQTISNASATGGSMATQEGNAQNAPRNARSSVAPQSQGGVSQSSADVASSYGARGKAAFEEIMAENNWTPEQTKRRFQSAYELGLTEAPRRKVRLIDAIQETAYNAGRQDAILSMKKEKSKGATIWGKNGGLVENDYTKRLDNRTFDTLNKIGRATGTKIIFENIPAEENSDGYYKASDGTIHIDINMDKPIMTVVKHELTHRLQTLAPREYRAFRNYAVSVMNGSSPYGHTATEAQRLDYLAKSDGEINLNTEEAMDELASNFTERILTDEKALNDFVNHITSSAENMTMGQKFFQVVREFIDKVKAVFNGDRGKMDAAAQKEFGATISQLEKAERLWKNAYAAAAKRAQKSGTSQNTLENNSKEGYNGDIKHALKKWRTDLNKSQYEILKRKIKHDAQTSENSITDTANWYSGNIEGVDVFAIYSTQDISDPTILYERKGEQGKAELNALQRILEVIEYGESVIGKQGNIDRLLSGNWVQKKHDMANNNDRPRSRGSDTGYASVLQGKSSQFIGSKAFRNVIRNLFEIQERTGELNEDKRHSLKEKKVAEVNENGIKQGTNISQNDKGFGKMQAEGTTGEVFEGRDSKGDFVEGKISTDRRRHNRVEKRTLEDLYDNDAFVQFYMTIGNEITDGQRDILYTKYENDARVNEEAYDFSEVVAYDMLSNADNELRTLFADSIDEYFNDNTSADVDATGRTIDKGIIDKLSKSVVRNQKGQLILLYHGTDKVHSTLKAGDIGIHFGSYNQATQRATAKEITNPVYIKAYLNITKPLIINRDGYNWNAPQVAMYLADAGLITSEQAQSFIDRGVSAETNQELADMIQDMGYDGIIYTNAYEAGAGKSYIVFDDSQVVRINDAKHSLKGEGDLVKDYEKLKNGQISSQEYEQLLEAYGAISPGEKPYREARVPRKTADGRKVSQTVRTILEAKATPDEAIPTIEKMVTDGDFSYDTYTDKQAIANANATIEKKGYATALSDWASDTEKGKVSKESTALGWALYNNAANSGDIKTAMTVLNKMVQHQRSAAQALQATRILKKLSPEGQLYGAQRSVESLQQELIDKYGDKAPELKINEKLAEQFLMAETEDERLAAEIEIYKDIGRQMPSDWLDMWNAWRYVAMLSSLRTHGKNILGNAAFAPVVLTKDLTATAIESAVAFVARKKGKEMLRGKAFVWGNRGDRALLKAAWNDYKNVADIVSNGGKYNDSAIGNKYVQEGRTIFKGILKPLDTVRKINSKLLEAEDVWFSKPHYAYALAQYCKANNITAEQIERGKAIAPAREYAIKEAQKATYKDTNELSHLVSSLGRNGKKKSKLEKAIGVGIEGGLPFRKTPANVLVRGIEYSPLGLLKGLGFDLKKVSKGEMTAAEAIDNISAGLTGTGLLALGIYLAAQGLIRGRGKGDEDEKEFEELMGHQDYALELPNGASTTLDWLAPASLPFFTGVRIWEIAQGKKEDITLSVIQEALNGISDPMLEMSFLQGLNNIFESVNYASSNDSSEIAAIISSAVTSYLSQGIPTLLGQAERTGEEYRMTTYTEKDDFLTGDAQYTLGKASAKIPFWDYNQIPYVDAWGRKEASGTALKRGLNNFLNPAYTSTVDESKMEKELLRLYEATGEGGVFPERADKYFTVDGKRKDLTGEEYVRYATLKGEKSYKLVSDLVKSNAYKKLSDEEKAKAVKEAYDYANQKAKQAISNYKPDTWVQKADEFGSNVGSYISFKTEVSGTKEDNGGKISKQEVAGIVLDMAQNDSDTWKMYLSMYDSDSDRYAYDNGVDGEDYMHFLEALAEVDAPTKSGKYGTYTQAEATKAVNRLDGLTRKEKSALWQSVNTTWKKNPF